MLGPIADNDQLGPGLTNLWNDVAQLRHLLTAEQSTKVTNENDDHRGIGPEIAQANLFAGVTGQFKRGQSRGPMHRASPSAPAPPGRLTSPVGAARFFMVSLKCRACPERRKTRPTRTDGPSNPHAPRPHLQRSPRPRQNPGLRRPLSTDRAARGRDRPMTPKPTANRPIRAFPTHRKAETAPACTEP